VYQIDAHVEAGVEAIKWEGNDFVNKLRTILALTKAEKIAFVQRSDFISIVFLLIRCGQDATVSMKSIDRCVHRIRMNSTCSC